jgi:multidrug efflux pump subunit AcrB
MNIAKFAVTRPVAVTMQIAALVLLGAICLTRLPVDLLPKVNLPTLNVSTSWPNVAPEEIESQITRRVEQVLSSVPGLYQISSTSSMGSSSVRVQFKWGTDIGQAAIDVMQRLERAKRGFPDDVQDPTVNRFDPNQMPVLNIGFYGEDDPVKLRSMLDEHIAPLIESADGVAAINISGGRTRSIMLNVDPVRLRAHGMTLADVMRRLLQENINSPAGLVRQSDTEYTIRSLGWLTTLEEIKAVPLAVILAIGIIYMLLAAQFESFTHPLSIMLSVPLASAGVILGLFLTGRSFGLTALIGMLMLVGIVVKNGILLVDYTNTLRKRGYKRNDAVLEASPTRLRPILMTASATILGMLPIALGIGEGAEIQAPMATAVIGGLITSTVLTLFVVPIVYTLLDDVTLRRYRGENGALHEDAETAERNGSPAGI